MPIYEYECGACRKRSSSLLPSWTAPDPACPHCGKAELRRLVSSFATTRSDEIDFGGGDDGFDSGGDDDFGDGGYGGGGFDDDDW
ncbi:MAG TPA: zinc ribbon domain-containing protein [Candidatus Dormibacteraeota bacterium]